MENRLGFRVESDKSFDDVAGKIEEQTVAHQFRVLAIHNVQETLAKKGLERGPLKIIEVCNAKFAHEALGKDVGAALFMPCKFVVFTDGDKTIIDLARPSMISQMLPDAGLDDLATSVEKTLKQIMAESV